MIEKFPLTNDLRIKHQQLVSQITRLSTFSFFDRLGIKEGSKTLCLNCGEGEIVFYLAGLVGENGSVVGVDPDPENIHTAMQLAAIKNSCNTSFYLAERYEQTGEQRFDLIYNCLLHTRFFDPANLIKQLQARLTPGGLVIFDVIDFSACNSIPRNFAFDRFLDLYTSLIQSYWGDRTFSGQLRQSLSDSGFRYVKHQYQAPTFSNGHFKQLPVLTFATIHEEVTQQNLATPEEVNALLRELHTLESQSYSMISLPSIHQIWGYRP